MDRDFWESFLNMYKMYPALWDAKNPDYCNRSLRDKAYADLVELCKTKYPTANRDYVAKKIHHFRCSFRREYRKVMNSLKSGQEVYTPTLWYYNLLLFITGSENIRKNRQRPSDRPADELLHDDELYYNDDTDNYEGEDEDDGEIASVTALYDSYDGGACQAPSDSGKSSIRSSIMPVRNTRKRKVGTDNVQDVNELLEFSVSDPLRTLYSSNREDEFEIAGKKLAADLRSLDYRQRVFAEKLIADTIFYAKLAKLDENCRIQPQ